MTMYTLRIEWEFGFDDGRLLNCIQRVSLPFAPFSGLQIRLKTAVLTETYIDARFYLNDDNWWWDVEAGEFDSYNMEDGHLCFDAVRRDCELLGFTEFEESRKADPTTEG